MASCTKLMLRLRHGRNTENVWSKNRNALSTSGVDIWSSNVASGSIQTHIKVVPEIDTKNRVVTFRHPPTEDELGATLGYGLMGSSNCNLKEQDDFLTLHPLQMPVVAGTIWMYFVLAVILVIFIWQGEQDALPYLIMLMGGIFIIPFMMSVLAWVNQQTGTESYLEFDKQENRITLPRLSLSFPKEQLREIVFLDRFVEGGRFWQIALLVEESSDHWTYAHLYNAAGSGAGMECFGLKDNYHRLADLLEIKFRRLKFSKTESESLSHP